MDMGNRETAARGRAARPKKAIVASLVASAALFCATATASASAGATTTPSQSTSPTTTASLASLPANYQAYWLATSKGEVYAAGGAKQYGTLAGRNLAKPIVGIAPTPTGGGYWLVASDGGVFTFGNAHFYGSTGDMRLKAPIVGMAPTPTGGGYWLVASDGGVFTFGNATFNGSTGALRLDKPVVGMASTPTGDGYWLVASDGGIFTFGDARFYGSMGGRSLAAPVVGMTAMPTGGGYRLVAADGGIFDFGPTTTFYGSLGGQPRPYPITAMTTMFSDKGYWLSTSQGGVQNFGAAQLFGSTPGLDADVVGMAPAEGNGDPLTPGYAPGSYGYDVSNYQCGNFPSGAHTIGIVEIDGWGSSYTNPCFITEVNWAGPGVNLYMFVVYGTSSTPEPGCTGAPVPTACDFGYATATSDFAAASSMINGRATVPWWLDIEPANWSSNKTANASVVMGAVDALHASGVATVGFYFALFKWTLLMGDYNPSGPLFPAWWGGPAPATKCVEARSYAASAGHFIPSGPVTLVQYSDTVHGFDGDYAC
jgi:hypothetical protein